MLCAHELHIQQQCSLLVELMEALDLSPCPAQIHALNAVMAAGTPCGRAHLHPHQHSLISSLTGTPGGSSDHHFPLIDYTYNVAVQVAECTVDLRQTKPYCIKKRLCPEHLNAQAVKRRGSNHGWWRFCQQVIMQHAADLSCAILQAACPAALPGHMQQKQHLQDNSLAQTVQQG